MNFSAGRNGIFDALKIATRINSKVSLPILGGVMLATDESEGIRLVATDLEMMIECFVPATIEQKGRATVSGKTLQRIIKDLPRTHLSISEAGSAEAPAVRLQCDKTEFVVPAMPAEDFPPVPEIAPDVRFSVSQKALATLIESVKETLGQDWTRPLLQAAELTVLTVADDTPLIRLVTTDTHRLSVRQESLLERPIIKGEELVGVEEHSLLVPGRALTELLRLLDDKSEDAVNVVADANAIRFTVGAVSLTSKLTEGRFPMWQRVVPNWTSLTGKLLLNKRSFVDGLKRLHIVACDGENRVTLIPEREFEDAGVASLKLQAESKELGTATHSMQALASGETVPVTINVNFLLDAMSTFKGEEIILETGPSPLAPAKLTSLDPADAFYFVVLMPMQKPAGE